MSKIYGPHNFYASTRIEVPSQVSLRVNLTLSISFFTMIPVSRSPAMHSVRHLNDQQERTSPPRSILGKEGTSGLLRMPFAPFCSDLHSLSQKNDRQSSKTAPIAFVNRHDRKPPPSSQPVLPPQVFIPIDRPPPMRHLRMSARTPPVSPFIGTTELTTLPLSPSPSLLSAAPTEDMTERSLTPYSQQSSSSYLQIAANIKPSKAAPYSGSGNGGYPCSPRKSPVMPSNYPSGRGSLPPFFHPRVPQSPGGNSIGSQSAQAEDQSRKQRAKTELCMHFINGRVCPFGVNCTYAHGEEELQMTKLMDLHRAGLLEDVKTYRTKPCLTWVATGSWYVQHARRQTLIALSCWLLRYLFLSPFHNPPPRTMHNAISCVVQSVWKTLR